MAEPAGAGELVHPSGDVLTVETVETDGAESGVDVASGPSVLLARLQGDVGVGGVTC